MSITKIPPVSGSEFWNLVNENEFRTKRTNIDALLSSIENDPYDLESKDPYKKREMEKFQKVRNYHFGMT